MEFQNLIEKRRSVRKYVERNTVTKDEIMDVAKSLKLQAVYFMEGRE